MNIGEHANSPIAKKPDGSSVPEAWKLLADRIPRTGLGFIWADEAAGCRSDVVWDLQQIWRSPTDKQQRAPAPSSSRAACSLAFAGPVAVG